MPIRMPKVWKRIRSGRRQGSEKEQAATPCFEIRGRQALGPEDAHHFSLFEFVVLGSQVSPERDIVTVRITFSSVWMILNAFRAIVAGWGFQSNGYVTGKLCRKNIDLVEFGVNSIPNHNNVLCLGVIPKGTEVENIYEITSDDFRTAAGLMCSYKDCGKPGCPICGTIMEVLSAEDVQKYTHSKKFREGQLPVETAMCDNIKG